jgi:DNA-binding XRE family transcriptional regulator
MSSSKHFYIKALACKGCLIDNAGVFAILRIVPDGTIKIEVIPTMEIGSIINSARNEAGLTQEQAADALCVSRQTVSNWENGKTYPDIISAIKMSDLYSVSLDHILKEETSMKQSYKEFLEESTNTVKSWEMRSKLALTLVTLGIW